MKNSIHFSFAVIIILKMSSMVYVLVFITFTLNSSSLPTSNMNTKQMKQRSIDPSNDYNPNSIPNQTIKNNKKDVFISRGWGAGTFLVDQIKILSNDPFIFSFRWYAVQRIVHEPHHILKSAYASRTIVQQSVVIPFQS